MNLAGEIIGAVVFLWVVVYLAIWAWGFLGALFGRDDSKPPKSI